MLLERPRYHSLSNSIKTIQQQPLPESSSLVKHSTLAQIVEHNQNEIVPISNIHNSFHERSNNRSLTTVKKMTAKIRILTPKNSILKDFFNEQFIARKEKISNNRTQSANDYRQMQSTSSFPQHISEQLGANSKNIQNKVNSKKTEGNKLPQLIKKGLTTMRSKMLIKSKMTSVHRKELVLKHSYQNEVDLRLPKIEADQNINIGIGSLENKQDSIKNKFNRNKNGKFKGLQFTFGEVMVLPNE